mmetsp:Transcript_55410/g.154384  ORF Transcript_55410/g.154384 Transcript_55410/m.154384 type:complete len:245 (+) Transcript_55410:130-864(+)
MGGKQKKTDDLAPKPKPPHLQGSEPLPTGHRSLPSETRNLAYFITTSQSSFPDHSKASRSHSLRALRDKVQYNTYCANKQGRASNTRNPLPKEAICEYSRNYQPKMLDNYGPDRALCELWTQAGRSGEKPPPAKLSSETAHKAFFTVPAKDGRQESCKPTRDGLGKNALLETMSKSRTDYPLHDPGMVERFRAELAPLGRKVSAATGLPQVPSTSQFGLDFREAQYGFTRTSVFPKVRNPVYNP